VVDQTIGHVIDGDRADWLGLPAGDCFLVDHESADADSARDLPVELRAVPKERPLLVSESAPSSHQNISGSILDDGILGVASHERFYVA
jgi:hypothetical protein